MTNSSRCTWAVGLGCGLFATSAFAQNPTIAIKAVKLNPTCVGGSRDSLPCVLPPDCPGGFCGGDITPTDALAVRPLDVIVADVLAFDYSPRGERLIGYEVDLRDFFAASVCGGVSFLRAPRGCRTRDDCAQITSSSATCDPIAGVCVADPPLDARAGSIDVNFGRFDYVFFAGSRIAIIDLGSPQQVRFFAALVQPSDARVYPGTPQYLGTIAFQVGAEMCGTVEVRPDPSPKSVLVRRDRQFILPLDLPPLTLTTAPDAVCGDGSVNQVSEVCDGADDLACPGRCLLDCTCAPAPICGDNDVNQASEACDGGDDSACPGRCLADCTCAPVPICGDNDVNQASEACDGADDSACPDRCRADCTCPPAAIPTVSQWGLVMLVLLLMVGGKICFGRRLRPRNFP